MAETTLKTRFLHPNKTEAQWNATTTVPKSGEILYTKSGDHDGWYKVGDGTHLWKDLSYVSGFMSSTERTKLNGIEEHANNYTLPVATSNSLGGVKSGGDLTIGADGTAQVADNSHNHTIANVTGLQSALDAKAPLASPSFTGTPKAPTANTGTNTTQIATTAFVQNAVNDIDIGGRNLIRNSLIQNRNCTTFQYDAGSNTWTGVAPTGSNEWGIGFYITHGGTIVTEPGDTFLVSFEVKPDVDCVWREDINNFFVTGESSGNDNDLQAYRTACSNGVINDRTLKANVWNKVWWSYRAKGTESNETRAIYDGPSCWGIITTNATAPINFQVRNIMGEHATTPSDWRPAPEDLVTSLSVSGKTVTYKNYKGESLGTITTQDTTYTAGSGISISGNTISNTHSEEKLKLSTSISGNENVDNFYEKNYLKGAVIHSYTGITGLGGNDGLLLSLPWENGNYAQHILFDIDDASKIYTRRKNPNSWASWDRIMTKTYADSLYLAKDGTAQKANYLLSNPLNRPTSANIASNAQGGLRKFLSTSSMTEAKPNNWDGHIIHMDWDSNNWASQLYVGNRNAYGLWLRTQSLDGGVNWDNWMPIAHAQNKVGSKSQPVYMDADGTLKTTSLTNLDINPIASKTYTGLYGSANDAANASFYFFTVKPTTYYVMWKVRYRVHCWVPGKNYYDSYSDVEIWGFQGSLSSYKAFNAHSYEGSAIRRSYYFHNLYRATSTGSTTYGHAIGLGLRASNESTNSAYPRSVLVEVLETENCTLNMFDTALKYASIPGTGSTNYSGLTEMDAYNVGLRESGDDNDTYTVRNYYTHFTAGTNGIKQYSLVMEDANGTWQSLTTTHGVDTNKAKNTTGFKLGQIYYMNTNSNYNSGAVTGDNVVTSYGLNFDFRYSSNCGTTLVTNKPLYIVGTYNDATGLFYLADTWWSQTLPTTEDGKLYIQIGYTRSNYQFDINNNLPIYWYKGGRIREDLRTEQFYGNATTATTATKADYLTGFTSEISSAAWGNQNGTVVSGLAASNGGDLVWRANGSQLNQVIDGFYYQNEGKNLVLDSVNYSNYALPLSGGNMTGSINFALGHSIYAVDRNGNNFCLIRDNGTNLWIGAKDSSGPHHSGAEGHTFITTGYNTTDKKGNDTIYVSIPNATNNGHTSYGVLHTGNYNTYTIPITGTTINNPNSSSFSLVNAIRGNLIFADSGNTSGEWKGIGGVNGANDGWVVRGYQTSANAGHLEIAVGDDGAEGIYVRQYISGGYKLPFMNKAGADSGLNYRQIELMAPSSGATTFPTSVKSPIYYVDKLMTYGGKPHTIFCDHNLVSYNDTLVSDANTKLTTSTGDEEWLKALLKKICTTYPNTTDTIFKGKIGPNSQGFYEVYIYNTSTIDSTTGLPQHSYGIWRKWSPFFAIFGTSSYNFNFYDVLTDQNYESIVDDKFLKLSGDTMTGDLLFSNSGTNIRQIRGIVGDNDYWRIAGGATASNGGWMEIATADDGNEPIYVRQYTGVYATLKRGATILDANGATSFPVSVTAPLFVGKLQTAGVRTAWHKGRDNALVRTTAVNGYSPLASAKTTNGSWEIGTLHDANSTSYTDDLIFSYVTDADYANNNRTTCQIKFLENSTVVASTFQGNLSGNAATFTATATVPSSRNYLLFQQDRSSGNGATNARYHNSLAVSSNISTENSGTQWTELWIGTSIASGTAGNSQGWIALYTSGANHTQITTAGTGNNNYFYIPNYAGSGYAVTAAGAGTYGSSVKPVYVAANGRITAFDNEVPRAFMYTTEGSGDANTFYNAGTYHCSGNSLVNGPRGYGYGQILVIPYRRPSGNTTPDYAGQIAIHGAGSNENQLHYRTSNSTTWGAWQVAAHGAANTAVGHALLPVYMTATGAITTCNVVSSGAWFNGMVRVGNDGVMEIGKYIDFHTTTDTTADYDIRLEARASDLYISKTVTVNGDIWAGNSSRTTKPTGSIHVHDLRTYKVTVTDYNYGVNFYFSDNNATYNTMPTSEWWSVMHVNGWTGDYNAWELAGPSNNNDQRTTPLYVRSGRTTNGWGSWRKIYDTSNKPSASDVGALPISGGTLTGAVTFANGTWNIMGDDAYIGDHNVSGMICIKGKNNTTGLRFYHKDDEAKYSSITFDGWLRINESQASSSGVYFGSSLVRTDGQLRVGSGNAGANYSNISTTNVTVYGRANEASINASYDGGGKGSIYLYANPTSKNRGIYTYNSAGTGKAVIGIDDNNNITFNGNAVSATSAAYLTGFVSRGSAASWGNQNGTVLTTLNTTNGGVIAFRENGTQLNVVIDGCYYQREGNYLVLDQNNYSTYLDSVYVKQTGGIIKRVDVTGSLDFQPDSFIYFTCKDSDDAYFHYTFKQEPGIFKQKGALHYNNGIYADYFKSQNLYIRSYGQWAWLSLVNSDTDSGVCTIDMYPGYISVDTNFYIGESSNYDTRELRLQNAYNMFKLILTKKGELQLDVEKETNFTDSYYTTSATSPATVFIYKHSNTSSQERITFNCWVQGKISNTSDVRLKENITNTSITNALDSVNHMQLREFDWKEDHRHQKIGLVADELEKIDKDLVVGEGGYYEDGTMNTKAIDTYGLQMYMLKAIQELSQENKQLKEQISTLMNRG